jgi:hypothetical protein
MAEIADLSQGDVLSRLTVARHHLADPVILHPGAQAGAIVAVEEHAPPRASVGSACLAPVLSEGLQCEAVIVSQTCDVRQDVPASITVAPVLPMSSLSPEQHGACSRDRMLHYVPLASPHGTYVDLHWVAPIAKGSVAAARRVAQLEPNDIARLRLKLSIMLGRPALPDDVVHDLRLIRDAVGSLSMAQRQDLLGAYIKCAEGAVDVQLVTRAGARPTKLQKAFQRWLEEPSGHGISRSGAMRGGSEVTLAELHGYARLALDYLSFPLRMEEA